MMKNMMKTAVVQMSSTDDKRANIEKAVFYVRKAIRRKAKFVLLPEMFIYRGQINQAERTLLAESIPGPTVKIFQKIAQAERISILMGSIYEKVDKYKKVCNTSIFIDQNGQIKGRYRKIHLFDAIVQKEKIMESTNFIPGKRKVLVDLKPFKLGMAICYDIRFSNLFHSYTMKGATVICLPSAFTLLTGRDHWEVLLRARAIENMCYVLAPNQVGPDNRNGHHFGHSMIIDPWGKILACANRNEENVIYADLDINKVNQLRKRFPGRFKIKE